MNRPYKHTLTQADRIVFQKWLIGTSAFWGLVTLLIIVSAIASHDRRTAIQNETTAQVRSDTRDKLVCPGRSQREYALCAQTDRNGQ
jgi:hypothetical protein